MNEPMDCGSGVLGVNTDAGGEEPKVHNRVEQAITDNFASALARIRTTYQGPRTINDGPFQDGWILFELIVG